MSASTVTRKEWKWKPTAWAYSRFDAATIGTYLEAMAHETGCASLGGLDTTYVVERARAADSPLHEIFEWDDSAAAEAHRRHQAQRLVNSLGYIIVPVQVTHVEAPAQPAFTPKVQIVESLPQLAPEPLLRPAFVSVRGVDGKSRFIPTDEAMAQAETRAEVARDALRGLIGWRKRFRILSDYPLARQTFEAIDLWAKQEGLAGEDIDEDE